jgi:hypothetical protein
MPIGLVQSISLASGVANQRLFEIGLDIRSDSAYNFLADLIRVGVVTVESEPLWN